MTDFLFFAFSVVIVIVLVGGGLLAMSFILDRLKKKEKGDDERV